MTIETTVYCRCCNRAMKSETQPALMPTQDASLLVTCQNHVCSMYGFTFIASDYSSVELHCYGADKHADTDDDNDTGDSDLMSIVLAGSVVGREALYALCQHDDNVREERLAYSYSLLQTPPPVHFLRWFCPNCGYEHCNIYYGGEATCACGLRRLWKNVHISQPKLQAAREAFEQWQASNPTMIKPYAGAR